MQGLNKLYQLEDKLIAEKIDYDISTALDGLMIFYPNKQRPLLVFGKHKETKDNKLGKIELLSGEYKGTTMNVQRAFYLIKQEVLKQNETDDIY